MAVYFIQAGEFGPIKIGFAENVRGRLIKMQADNHETLYVRGVIDPGDAFLEAELQRRFDDLFLRGEWFAPAQKLLSFIGSLPPWNFPASVWQRSMDKTLSPLGRYLAAHKLTAKAFGDLVGVSEFAIGKYVRGERTPRRHIMKEIRRVTDGTVTADDFTDDAPPDDEQAASQDSAA